VLELLLIVGKEYNRCDDADVVGICCPYQRFYTCTYVRIARFVDARFTRKKDEPVVCPALLVCPSTSIGSEFSRSLSTKDEKGDSEHGMGKAWRLWNAMRCKAITENYALPRADLKKSTALRLCLFPGRPLVRIHWRVCFSTLREMRERARLLP
jgi:hypothetical protein